MGIDWANPNMGNIFSSTSTKSKPKSRITRIGDNKCLVCPRTSPLVWAHFPPRSRGGNVVFRLCPNHHRLIDRGKFTNAQLKKLHLPRGRYVRALLKKRPKARGNKSTYPLDVFKW